MPTTASALDLPFDEAIAFFRQKASVPTERWTDVYAAAHSHSFMVAGANTEALVDDFRAEIDKAISEGTTIAEFRDGFDRIVEKHGWEYKGKRGWRTRVIFDTNLRTAYAAGRYAQQTLPETLQAFPFWQYHHSGSLHPRKQHLAWDGMVLRADDSWWSTNYPPNGWRCGCYSTPVSPGGLKRMGKLGPDEAPELLFRAEEVGGVRREVPFGVDPGFEYNPGAEWLRKTAPGPTIVAASPELVTAFVRRAMETGRGGRGWVPVETVPGDMAKAFGTAAGTEVRLSADTIVEHASRHPEATAEAYAELVARAVRKGEMFRDRANIVSFVEDAGRALWKVAFKVSVEGDVYAASLHRSNTKQLARFQRSRQKIR